MNPSTAQTTSMDVDRPRVAAASGAGTATYLQALQQSRMQNQERRWQALGALFRSGHPLDSALDGRYQGALLALDLTPFPTGVARRLAARWMPWLGKQFDARNHSGDNIFSRDSLWLTRLY